MSNSGPFTFLSRALIPVLLGTFGLAYTVQERQAEEFELLVSLLTDEAPQRRQAGDSLWIRYSLRCDELIERITLQCRLGEEYREIISGLVEDARSANLVAYEQQPERQQAVQVSDIQNEAVGALSGDNPFDLLPEDELMEQAEAAPAPPEPDARSEEEGADAPGSPVAGEEPPMSRQTVILQQAPISKIVQRLNPQVYIHISPRIDREAARRFELALEQYSVNDRPIVVPGIQLVSQTPDETQLRYLKEIDREEAFQIAAYLRKLGCDVAEPISLAGRYNEDKRVRPRTYELWFAPDSMSAGCLNSFAQSGAVE